VGAEHHHGNRRSDFVPARRALKLLRRARVAIASLALLSATFNSVGTIAAVETPTPLDPRFAALLKARPCGSADAPPSKEKARAIEAAVAAATAAPRVASVEAAAPAAAAIAPAPREAGARDGLERIVASVDALSSTVVAQATPEPSAVPTSEPTPVPSAAPSAAAATASPAASAPAATGTAGPAPIASAGSESTNQGVGSDQTPPLPPPPSPAPSASATQLPIPPPPGYGPSQIIQPTPRATGPATASPVPLPTPSASAGPPGPVFLVRPSGMPTTLPLVGGAQGPAASPTPMPAGTPPRILQPYEIVTIADKISGNSNAHQPTDLTGNVHIFYVEGQIVGDRAHYDGDHTIVVSGHTYLVNRSEDSILYADKIVFDLRTHRATLENGRGESIEGVAQGKLHFDAETLTARSDGTTHGDHAYFTTCENPHGGYHVEARTIDVFPGDRLIARKAVVFLGPLAILYLPFLVIPLRGIDDPRRQSTFFPLVGYDQTEGAWIKLRLGFAPSDTYYGYYRLEYYTKRGLGVGYDSYIGAKDHHRFTTIDFYTIDDHVAEARETNFNLQDTETFSQRLRGQFGVNYQGDFGPNLTLPASLDITGSLIHQTGNTSTENLTFSRFLQGSLSDNLNLGFIDSITLGQFVQQQINLTYSKFNSPLSSSDTFHIDLDTHVFTKAADYDFTYDKTDYSQNPFGYDSIPQLQILPHINWHGFKYAPQVQFTLGEYAEPENHFSTSRFQGQLTESYYAKVFGNSDFTANYNLTQDYYGTGDEKAFDQQNASLSTPIGNHLVNSITYNEQHPIGPSDVPFQLLDNLSPGAHSAQDVIRFYNKDVYSLSLSDGTNFNEQGQPITYQLNYKPSTRSYIVVGGYYQPGPGNGFTTTNVQAITPLGKDSTLELTTNVDWKNHMRLEDKNIYLSQIVDNCYQLQFSYNQDLKQFSFQIVILAFPTAGAGVGFGGNQSNSIIPQNLNY
jgi:lipopolysaccharide assembly outer membrane protein LptD (OstA)